MTPLASDAVVTFSEGLPGFETCRRFVLVRSATLEPFTVVQGLDGAAPPAFVAIDPHLVERDYFALLDGADLDRLDADPGKPLLWLAIVATQPDGAATVNLRAPIVINPAAMRGIQVLSGEDTYPLEHPLQAA
jgi:flagellar assembly factor FliW